MRQIKFRIWNHFLEKMSGPKPLCIDSELIQFYIDKPPHHDFVLMQYTGFKDFDGKEIYEGDILEYVSYKRLENKRIEIVEYSEACGGWYLHKQADTLATVLFEQHNENWQSKRGYSPSPKHKVRIIGNIYENPELVKP